MSSDANTLNPTDLDVLLDDLFFDGVEDSDLDLDLLFSDDEESEGFNFEDYVYGDDDDGSGLEILDELELGELDEFGPGEVPLFDYFDYMDAIAVGLDSEAIGEGDFDALLDGSFLIDDYYDWEPDIVGDDGDNELVGTDADEWIEAGGGNDTVEGGGGYDDIDGGDGNDLLSGGDDMDYLYGGSGDDVVNGDDGDDDLEGGDGNDTLNGGNGNDWLWDDAGDDSLNGDDGDDSFDLYEGNNIANGGAGEDTFYIYGGVNEITGGADADTFVLDGYVWDDGSADGAGDSPDQDYGIITDFEPGVDKFELEGLTFDVLTLVQDGNDTQIFDGDNLLAILQNVSPDQLSASDFETYYWGTGEYLVGTQLDDALEGTGEDDYVEARGGNDVVNGNEGDDYLYGGEGNDLLNGGDGMDSLDGGDGDDTLVGGAGDDYLDDYAGNNVLDAGDGNDSVWVEGGDNVIDLGAGDDYVSAIDGVNEVTLGAGADIVSLGGGYFYWTEDDAESGESGDGDENYMIVTDFEPTEDSFEIFDVEYDELTFEQEGSNTNILDGDDLLAVVQGVNPGELSEDNVITYGSYWGGCDLGDICICGDYLDIAIDEPFDSLGSGSDDLAAVSNLMIEPMVVDMADIEPASFM